MRSYFQSIGTLARVTLPEESALATAWRTNGCTKSRERLITANLRLVIMMAKRYSHRGVAFDELVAEGNLGLIHAVDNFDPSAGARFSTYAVYWIRHSISEVFARSSRNARLTRSDRLDVNAVDRATATFHAAYGRVPSEHELAEALDWQPDRVRSVQRLIAGRTQTHSLNDGSDSTFHVPTRETVEHDGNDSSRQAERLGALLDLLSPQERQVIELRFGLCGREACSLNLLADSMGVAPRIVKIRLESAMMKLTRTAQSD